MIERLDETLKVIANFNDIEVFNMLGGHLSKENDPQLNFNLLQEELNEYLQASQAGDRKGVADALGDMMVVLWGNILKEGMGDIFFSKILEPINTSNMSKFCKTEEEAVASVKYYAEGGLKTIYKEIYPGFYAIINDQEGSSKKGKILKGINYKEPEINV